MRWPRTWPRFRAKDPQGRHVQAAHEPDSFQGLREEGLKLLSETGRRHGLVTVTEVLDVSTLDIVARHTDMIQVGARNMYNTELLKALGRLGKPVLLKRGFMATLEELLLSAEYILAHGSDQVVLCERGIRTFEPWTRNTLDIAAVPLLKQETRLPVIVDLSHATGGRHPDPLRPRRPRRGGRRPDGGNPPAPGPGALRRIPAGGHRGARCALGGSRLAGDPETRAPLPEVAMNHPRKPLPRPRDRIFADPKEKISDFNFGRETSQVFDDMLDRSVPFYGEIQRMTAELAADLAAPGTCVYDLGCSPARRSSSWDTSSPVRGREVRGHRLLARDDREGA